MRILEATALAIVFLVASSVSHAQPAAPAEDEGARTGRGHDSPAASRTDLLARQNGLNGSTGLLRVAAADSGATGTFRVTVTGSYYNRMGFLCPVCEDADGDTLRAKDKARLFAMGLQLSLTPLEFLEGHAALGYRTTSNSLGDPEVIRIAGDTTLGVKGFIPRRPDRVYSVGAGARVDLHASPSAVGFDAASVGLHGGATLDLANRTDPRRRVPLRAHLHAGYLFDNSAILAEAIESERNQSITRIERFGYRINRVDTVRLGIGVEGPFGYVAPFWEWTLDIPVNRQDHFCRTASVTAGDECLFEVENFRTTPLRVTLGARAYPWFSDWMRGLMALVAVDVGIGGILLFTEELSPEPRWMLHVGLGYAVDTVPQVQGVGSEMTVERTAEPPALSELAVWGTVVDAKTEETIAGATVTLEGTALSALLTDPDGRFRTPPLKPGVQRFRVTMDGYRDGTCEATIIEPKQRRADPAQPDADAPDQLATREGRATEVRCELEPLPKVSTVVGALRDAQTTVFVSGASVRITDERGRRLTLQTDERGAFRFENVPAGRIRLRAEAGGYLPSVMEFELTARKDVSVQLTINRRPDRPKVVVTQRELRLMQQVQFLHDSAEMLPGSSALIQEIAEALRLHPEIAQLEIQGHTDDTGTPRSNLRLSEERAKAVREALIRNGVKPRRLVARGHGEDKPLVPNTSAANRARNRRIQLIIVKP